MAYDTLDIPKESLAAICRRYRVRELSLFGSALGEHFRPDSDVDLLVEFEEDAYIGFMALAHLRREFSDAINRPVGLVPKASLKPAIRSEVLAQAEVLFAA